MQSRNRHLLTAAVLAGAVCAAVVASRPPAENSAKGEPNPAAMRIAYRPGGYFPDGFPLHGKVKLVTAPVVEMGQRTRVRIEYTVGDMPVTTGTTLQIWKHFTSDVESFQVADAKAPAYFSAEFTSPNVRGKTTGY